mmetsp:Transcript_22695/g.36056  ORF Transcript_22695/g.36056 Transcript_22695/m.36056 type:complete len:212 (+) Transcript_22695:803-1438(+)
MVSPRATSNSLVNRDACARTAASSSPWRAITTSCSAVRSEARSADLSLALRVSINSLRVSCSSFVSRDISAIAAVNSAACRELSRSCLARLWEAASTDLFLSLRPSASSRKASCSLSRATFAFMRSASSSLRSLSNSILCSAVKFSMSCLRSATSARSAFASATMFGAGEGATRLFFLCWALVFVSSPPTSERRPTSSLCRDFQSSISCSR